MFLHGSKPSAVRRTTVTVKKSSGVSKTKSKTKRKAEPSSSGTSPSFSSAAASPIPVQQRVRYSRPGTSALPSPVTPVALFSDLDSEPGDEENKTPGLDSAGRDGTNDTDQLKPMREWRDLRPLKASEAANVRLIHGADLTKSDDAERYLPVFSPKSTPAARMVDLHYPGVLAPERFELVYPTSDRDGYSPADDIVHTIDTVLRYFFPGSDFAAVDPSARLSVLASRFRRAVMHQTSDAALQALKDYNSLVTEALASARASEHVRRPLSPVISPGEPILPLSLTERILSQVYGRTISPQVAVLRQYENGTSAVYGELLPRMVSKILTDTGVGPGSVFVDLGSGVGNVVLQAALQTGADSWGIEMSSDRARLARVHAREFVSRTRLWGLRPGQVRLFEGDFCSPPAEINDALSKADVVLVNNKAFLASLDDQLLLKFLDLKDGARIVSLRTFRPRDWQITARNKHDVRNLLSVETKEYFSGSVSWTDAGGEYYVATKDSARLRKHLAGDDK